MCSTYGTVPVPARYSRYCCASVQSSWHHTVPVPYVAMTPKEGDTRKEETTHCSITCRRSLSYQQQHNSRIMFPWNAITFRRVSLLSKTSVTRRRFATGFKPYVRPLTYKEQVAQGVPFGKRKLHGREQQLALQVVVGEMFFRDAAMFSALQMIFICRSCQLT